MPCMHPITTNTLLNTNTKDETRYAVHLHRTAQANDTKRQLALLCKGGSWRLHSCCAKVVFGACAAGYLSSMSGKTSSKTVDSLRFANVSLLLKTMNLIDC